MVSNKTKNVRRKSDKQGRKPLGDKHQPVRETERPVIEVLAPAKGRN